jgi:integrase
MREYTYIRKPAKRRGVDYAPDAVARIIEQWQRSPEWRQLAPNTVKRYVYGLRWLDEYRRVAVGSIKRKDMLAVRDVIAEKSGNGAANSFVNTVSAFLTFATERGHIEFSPMIRVRRLPMGEWRRWPEETIIFALEKFPAHMARAVKLALYTGQRSGDCAKMLWADYDGEGIAVKQQKTGKKLWIACHEALKAELGAWPRTAVTILTDAKGQPWKIETFQNRMYQEIHRHVELTGLQFHGLRKSAAARLAEAGCTVQEIAAITGHSSLSLIGLYTRDANQRLLATAAIVKLERAKREK